ncbi:uncharacterized protein F5Z01DRAFT_632712 [Emericellopsis atlantica]|uniref:Uncharacterized protein n=1 Tax=Emericellopsis atlantica TaxID=2614577 RepID=A0A9P7ZUL9_9HYPO|nr:uncharacterized protein F5Z01DRAFT_632712 [Emericellopsis atlantica]KAG9258638.1 hypothetical protein F5Z01DRAFT_632712 [Emericellopsis atlantica]
MGAVDSVEDVPKAVKMKAGEAVFSNVNGPLQKLLNWLGAVDGVEDAPKAFKMKGAKGHVKRSYMATGDTAFFNVNGPLQKLLNWLGAKERVGILAVQIYHLSDIS